MNTLPPGSWLTEKWEEALGGFQFNEVIAKPVPVPQLPDFVSQVRVRRALRGELVEDAYVVGAGAVIGDRREVLSAGELREIIGLDAQKPLFVQLFGKDKHLERVGTELDLIRQLARAGYDGVIAPSFSIYSYRPRPNHLMANKRSLLIFWALQRLGAPAIPRLAWLLERDVERWADWANANPDVEFPALDLDTCKDDRLWTEQMRLLALFDSLTGRRLTFLVNGPSRVDRCLDLYSATSPERIVVTNARAIARPATASATFRERAETERKVIEAAQRLASKGTRSRSRRAIAAHRQSAHGALEASY